MMHLISSTKVEQEEAPGGGGGYSWEFLAGGVLPGSFKRLEHVSPVFRRPVSRKLR